MNRIQLLAIIVSISIVISCCSPLTAPGATMSPPPDVAPPDGDMDSAEYVLIAFFDALSRNDFKAAAQYHWAPNPLIFLYPEIDQEDAEALLTRACTDDERFGCRFYCWRIKDVVGRARISPEEYAFTVRFEDHDGNLLTGGDNVTPRVCVPPGCPRSEYTYVVKNIEEKFYVDGIPVFSGCWP